MCFLVLMVGLVCADFVARLLANEGESYNWLWEEYRKPLKMTEADTLLVAMPVCLCVIKKQ